MKPILKYRGGKSKEIPLYIKFIPKFNTYFEPFFGGGATFFYLEPQNARINDVNAPLMNFYEEIGSDKFSKIKSELLELQNKYETNRKIFINRKAENQNKHVEDPNEQLYYQIRNMFNKKIDSKYEQATLYYFINKTAYSGMIRYNNLGEFNVPYGRYANLNTSLLTQEHHKLLSSANIHNSSYELSFQTATTEDFIYIDPPYDTVFSGYGNEAFTGDFGEKEHRKLAEDFRNLSAPALMIVGETGLIRDLYEPFIKGKYSRKYAVNIRNRFKSESNHLIITNY